MKPLTAIALSGGIDSATAAYLLTRQGRNVIGIHFITGYETASPGKKQTKAEARRKLSSIADRIGIDIRIIDCSAPFKKKVVDYFIQTYGAGRTPNPCMVCNASIKFGHILSAASKLGASRLATGHYARLTRDQYRSIHLLKGVDAQKDQSYFLARLTRSQLSRADFPLGQMTKSEVARLAQENGIIPAVNRESQDICFIRGKSYSAFLAEQDEFDNVPGPIEDIDGKIIGEHNGLYRYTIGQRRGIGLPASEPYYVVRIDPRQNRLVVGFKKALKADRFKVEEINWISDEPHSSINVLTRVRYRHKAAASTLFPVDRKTAVVQFNTQQSAITPGQGAVFYRDDEVLGGGWITEEIS